MFNRRMSLAVAMLAGLGGAMSRGADAIVEQAVGMSNLRTFAQRYGNNPRSLNGNSHRNSKAAQQKRAAVKRRNIAKHPRSTFGRKRRA